MDYSQMLEQLRSGELDKFVVTSQEFSDFYVVWQRLSLSNAIRELPNVVV